MRNTTLTILIISYLKSGKITYSINLIKFHFDFLKDEDVSLGLCWILQSKQYMKAGISRWLEERSLSGGQWIGQYFDCTKPVVNCYNPYEEVKIVQFSE